MKKFPFYKQPDYKDCGPTCLRIVSKFHGKLIPLELIRNLSETTRVGSSLMGLSNAAEKIGYKSLGIKIDFKTLKQEVPLPCIVFWNKEHFVVVYDIDRYDKVYISDPSYGLITYTREEFIKHWIGENADEETEEGVVLALETTPAFYKNEFEHERRGSLKFLSRYLFRYRPMVFQLAIGLVSGSVLSLFFPFLTQSVVDVGIQNQDLNFVYLVLLAQVMLFTGRTFIDILRSWILLHLSTRINISIVSDFFIKLMNLPISFFDSRLSGDILERINDHNRIEQLITNSSLNTLFSLVNIIVFSIVLLLYDYRLFLLYFFGTILYLSWISFFLKKRRTLDYKRFSQLSEEQSKVIELIKGMQEIKLHNAEKQKRWGWEFLQIKLFKIRLKSLSLEQWQSVGGNFINIMRDIFVSFLSAKLVISGNLTLGMMISVQYIIGQLNGPLLQIFDFIKQTQDAKICVERLNEIHNKTDEEHNKHQYVEEIPLLDINVSDVSFRYMGQDQFVLKNLNITIPYKKTTAIVGASGSGKTTLLKLLMKFYEPNNGEVKLGNLNIKNISPSKWRENCGVVMQDSYIFNDTIANNVAVGANYIDSEKLMNAMKIANIDEFVGNLPLGHRTKIGNEGLDISGGQKQRIFIARAVYKSPEFIFFDEATSALDANNEKTIMGNLQKFLVGKTALIIAHRLSTVKNADKIIVLDKGKIVEEGNHKKLISLRGEYYRLVKNQLEIGQ